MYRIVDNDLHFDGMTQKDFQERLMFEIILRFNYTILSHRFKPKNNIKILFYSPLTLFQTTNFRLFQTQRVCRRQFIFDENGRKFSKRVENTEGTGEIARHEQFLLFPQCFLKTCTAVTYRRSHVGLGKG